MANVIDRGPVHSLYVGCRDGGAFPNNDRQSVIDAVATSFDSFTVIDASGIFQGRDVATLVIKIATDDGATIEELARSLGHLLNQRAIGLETAGLYQSILMGERHSKPVGCFRQPVRNGKFANPRRPRPTLNIPGTASPYCGCTAR